MIFTSTLEEEVFRKSNLDGKEINIYSEQLTDLRFADDVALKTSSVEDLQHQLRSLNEESKQDKGRKAGNALEGMYKGLLTSKQIPNSLKSQILKQCILNKLTYDAEVWSTTNEMEQKLRTRQRAKEKKRLNISLRDKLRHSIIYKTNNGKGYHRENQGKEVEMGWTHIKITG
ncbi:uncharacterized protein LOC117107543 [Anneissia japonica]|uniref:uncharacterized protein LOC117107543 n=1 Tax=Anneissia japonica TaxID=1529436 RepID=UPI0014255A54|nr:uncharacterized protein LOC117107543 [Anneissia japonica]